MNLKEMSKMLSMIEWKDLNEDNLHLNGREENLAIFSIYAWLIATQEELIMISLNILSCLG